VWYHSKKKSTRKSQKGKPSKRHVRLQAATLSAVGFEDQADKVAESEEKEGE